MHPKMAFDWLYRHIRDYNLFISEFDVNENDTVQRERPRIVVKSQRYATGLYILFLIGK